MKTKPQISDEVVARGEHLLQTSGLPGKPIDLDECAEYTVRHREHPLGLALPYQELGYDRRDIMFVGAGRQISSVDMSMHVFLANIRFWCHPDKGRQVTGLRIISMPLGDGDPTHHYVFFEIRSGGVVIISGETTDFPGGNFDNMLALTNVFQYLSATSNVQIENVSAEKINLEKLYGK